MIELEVQVDGERQVIARLDGMTDAIRARLRPALEQSGEDVKGAAASLAPHKSGKGSASIKARLREAGDKLSEAIKPSRFYMRFQETGLDTMRKSARHRGIVGVRTRLTKSGTVLVSSKRGLTSRTGGGEHPFHLPAHPFMRPAFASVRDRIFARIQDAVAAGAKG